MGRQRSGPRDELGAHVSAAGGVDRAPARAARLGSIVLQMFTKAPGRWADPRLDADTIGRFPQERARHGITCVAVHDAYLINLAARDRTLFRRSYRAFRNELERCTALGVEYLVTHPGHSMGGRVHYALKRNARAVADALEEVPGRTAVLFETTAGTGSALGATFTELAQLIDAVPPDLRERVGVCLDTCHVWAAGYDLREDPEGVLADFDALIGLDRLRFMHLNDSLHDRGSRRDRHTHIGKGKLGTAPFAHLLNDPRLLHVPKVIETPKGHDEVRADRANLRRLRRLRGHGRA